MAESDLKRVDFESYFLCWDSVLFYPNPAQPENESILYGHSGGITSLPCHQHRACGALVKAETKYPPRVCPHCHVDTKKEQMEREARGESKGDPREALNAVSQT